MWKIEVLLDGRWSVVGGTYPTREAANQKILVYLAAGARKRTPRYRVVRA